MQIPEYIPPDLDVNVEDIEDEAYAYIQSAFPTWEPRPAQLDAMIIQYFALRAGVVTDQLQTVYASIFKYFGKSLLNLPPNEAVQATVSTTWTAEDSAGHIIPEGSVIALADVNGDLQPFATIQEETIPAASASLAGVTVRALTAGELANNLSGTVQVLTALDWLASVSVQGASSGGEDAEDDDAYMARLARRISIMAPRPVLADDFALMAMDEPGVYRATASDNTEIQTRSEINQISLSGYTGGSFTVTVDGQTTSGIAYNANLATWLSTIEALSTVAPGDLVLTGANPGTVTLTWGGAKANVDIVVSVNFSGLTGPGSASLVQLQQGGSQPRYDVERAVAVSLLDENGAEPAPAVVAAVDAILQASREQNFIVNIIPPTFTTVNVDVSVVAIPGWDHDDVDAEVTTAIEEYLSPANWGMPFGSDGEVGWDNVTFVRYLELATLVNNIQGVDYVQTLQLGAPTLGTSNILLTGIFPLPQAGTVTVTVN